MEKRKLAKIPREEASDEMVRFAERAAGTHIVTTKDIEKDLLMVTFYSIRKLKKGKKDAQLRTFFSKNDYISQDLTVEKVKWLTAAYDRMYDISLYEHHWDYKESTGRWTPNMFFWTDADIDRMRSFFKEWSTEKDVRDWTAVTPDIREERLQNCAKDWLDYLAWCKELKYDLTNMFFYFPKNFKKVHDRTAAEYQAVQDKKAAEKKRREEERIKREAEVMKKLLEEMLKENAGIDNAFLIKGKGLILRVPRDAQEIKNEGAALHHCVGTYVDRVAKGQTHIFFVRRVEEPDTPYFTMEYNRGRVIQCRGSHNCGMPPSVKTFVAAFEKLMKEREEKMERKCG